MKYMKQSEVKPGMRFRDREELVRFNRDRIVTVIEVEDGNAYCESSTHPGVKKRISLDRLTNGSGATGFEPWEAKG